MVIVELFPCESKQHLSVREQWHIDQQENRVNFTTEEGKEKYHVIYYDSSSEERTKNYEARRAERENHYNLHKEEINAKMKLYRETHKEEISEWKQNYYKNNIDTYTARNNAYRQNNKEQITAKQQATRLAKKRELQPQ
jgi:hypothetical protein